MPKHSPNAIPLQAADLLAYCNRQTAENVLQLNHGKDGRILDFILLRNVHVNRPNSEYGQLSEEEWRRAITIFRQDKKTHDLTRVILNMPKKRYSPLDFKKTTI